MGRVITFSGPRGVGKTTIMDVLHVEHGYEPIVPYTTRKRRPHETDGRDYHFLSSGDFNDLSHASPLFDIVTVGGNQYGTPLSVIEGAWQSEQTRTFNLASTSALELRKLGGEFVRTIMLLPASWSDVADMMRANGISEEDVKYRIDHEPTDLTQLPQFDQLVINPRNEIDIAIASITRYIASLDA